VRLGGGGREQKALVGGVCRTGESGGQEGGLRMFEQGDGAEGHGWVGDPGKTFEQMRTEPWVREKRPGPKGGQIAKGGRAWA